MKQFSILLLLVGMSLSILAQQAEKAPLPHQNSLESSTFTPTHLAPEAMWDIEFNYDAGTSLGFGSLAGAIYFGNEFWISQWNSETLFSMDASGNPIDTFSITIPTGNLSGTRAMTADDTSIYIANNSTTISQIDPATRNRIGGFNTSQLSGGQGIRFISYDASADNGNGGFWVGNFNTEIRLISRSGAVLQTIAQTTHGLTGMYGAAYDGQSPGGPYLWVFHQSGGPSSGTITQLSITKGGVPTLELRDASTDLTMNPFELAGGLFISDSLIAGKRILGGMLQSGNLFGYDLDFMIEDEDAVAFSISPSPVYTRIPEKLIGPITNFSGEIFNQGLTDPINIDVTISADSAGTNVFTGTPTTIPNIARYQRDTVNAPGSFTPNGQGSYELVLTAEAANGEEDDPSDGRASFAFSVGDSVYARDNGNFNATYNFFAAGYAGAIFDFPGNAFIKAVEVELGPGADQTGDSIYAIASPVTLGIPDNIITIRGVPQIVNAATNTYFLEFPFAVPVNAGQQWLFGIYKNDSISIAATTDNFEEGYNFFTGTAVSWSPSGVPTTRFIRPIVATCAGFRVGATATPDNGTSNGTVTARFKGDAGGPNIQWNDPNNSTSPIVTGLPAGTYTVTISDGNGCIDSATVEVLSNVSIDDQLAMGIQEWQIFPNPTSGQLTSVLRLQEATTVNIEVMDLMGKSLLQQDHAKSMSHEVTLDLSDLPAGIYMVQVQTDLGKATKRVVVK